ncbi:MAG: hypothetical protein C4531_01615 [Desulfurivibrio sp.]|nr:MAG: hypothetical protein C4531_01615 [Desulfurivibrio sp.]
MEQVPAIKTGDNLGKVADRNTYVQGNGRVYDERAEINKFYGLGKKYRIMINYFDLIEASIRLADGKGFVTKAKTQEKNKLAFPALKVIEIFAALGLWIMLGVDIDPVAIRVFAPEVYQINPATQNLARERFAEVWFNPAPQGRPMLLQ